MFRNTILCLRFPFLYPRNRFDDKYHPYIGWAIKILNTLKNKAYQRISLSAVTYKDPKECKEYTKELVFGGKYKIKLNNSIITIYSYSGKKLYEKNLQKVTGKDYIITGLSYTKGIDGNHLIQYHVHKNKILNANYGFYYIGELLEYNLLYKYLYKIFNFIYSNIIEKICFLPSFTELDALPIGWKKSFGIEICKEIKCALLKEGGRKALYNYRILQIKEKYNELRWYDSSTITEPIISKYTELSRVTCPICGERLTNNKCKNDSYTIESY